MKKMKQILLLMTCVFVLLGTAILDDAVDDVTDGVDDVTDDITDGVDKAADEMTEDNGADSSTQRNR